MSSEVILPALQLCPARNDETRVIQSRSRLGESIQLARIVTVKNDHESPLLVGQHHSRATRMRHLQHQRHIEDSLIPSQARLEVSHCESEMMKGRVSWLDHGENLAG